MNLTGITTCTLEIASKLVDYICNQSEAVNHRQDVGMRQIDIALA